MKTKIKNYGTIALFVAFSFIATVSWATDGRNDTPAVSLKYIGVVQNQPMFQLDLNSAEETEFYVSIKDQYGQVFYTEKIKAKNFTRNFRLDTESFEDAVLKVEVRDGNKKPEVFTINRNTRYYEETSISKL
ncbi:MAG TPA: hypothetical protein VGQ53_15780 [Chitinophagaceae bacterium]|jgi:hypothetical protein|nr:hypothetical protein [Chitinophagaceae bacterium]